MNDAEYALVKRRIHELLDIDLEAYKVQQMRRRLDSFVARRATSSVAEFCRALGANAAALDELRNMLTINVSEFFRDAAQFERLRNEVLPELLRRPRLRIWSAACSHGEEPYSIAIILSESHESARAHILATDIDRVVLAKAKAGGPYTQADLRNVPPAELAKYFVHEGNAYRVVDTLRRHIEFRETNLLSERFETNFDLIVCRNVMIYFSDETKQQLFERFRRSLNADGVLFVGGTEALLGPDRLGFERMGGNFYRKAATAQRARLSA